MPADLVNGADVGMIQGRRGTRFAAKTFQRLGILRQIVGKEFQRYKAAEFSVFGFIDYSHPAPAKLLENAVVRDGLADHLLSNVTCWTECSQ